MCHVLRCSQGAQGILDHASRAILESEFGTHKEDEVVEKILKGGEVQDFSVRVCAL